jgi:SAM-dependent methyltransferase
MENFWDQRYSEPGFAYGREPNEFFKEVIDEIEPGRMLLPGEGEGRNAIYAASKGWSVTAFDSSAVARRKALDWAAEENLWVNYELAELTAFECSFRFDLMAIVYIHLPPPLRRKIHRKLLDCLRSGGTLLMECFHKDQLKYGTGGPPVEELLYARDDLLEDFRELEIIRCENRILDRREGPYHSGKSSVIQLIARK